MKTYSVILIEARGLDTFWTDAIDCRGTLTIEGSTARFCVERGTRQCESGFEVVQYLVTEITTTETRIEIAVVADPECARSRRDVHAVFLLI